MLPFGRCVFQADLQLWVMEMCRAFLASLGTAEDGGSSSWYPQARGGSCSTLLHQGEIGSVGLFFGWRPEETFLGEGGGQELNLGLRDPY